MLGIPADVIDATEHLLGLADDLQPRRSTSGSVNGRYFVSSGGVGLDADTTRWVDDHPPLKRRAGPFFFSAAGGAQLLAATCAGPPASPSRRAAGVSRACPPWSRTPTRTRSSTRARCASARATRSRAARFAMVVLDARGAATSPASPSACSRPGRSPATARSTAFRACAKPASQRSITTAAPTRSRSRSTATTSGTSRKRSSGCSRTRSAWSPRA